MPFRITRVTDGANLEGINWMGFASHAIQIEDLARYWYCPAQILCRRRVEAFTRPPTGEGKKPTKEEKKFLTKMALMREHEDDTVLDVMVRSHANVNWALEKKGLLANGEDVALFASVLPEMNCVGIPDFADCTDGKQPIVVERKHREKILPWRPPPGDVVEVGAHAMALERIGFKPSKAVIDYQSLKTRRKRAFKITIDSDIRDSVRFTVHRVSRILEGTQKPIPTKLPSRCRSCDPRYREVCEWKVH
ncbi:MAG: Dna2/Cas4 domain-containing protein [Candidatus Bathyarchaeia archaeon]